MQVRRRHQWLARGWSQTELMQSVEIVNKMLKNYNEIEPVNMTYFHPKFSSLGHKAPVDS